MSKLNPYDYAASAETEHAQQVALFMALTMAANYGFTAALDAQSYGNPAHAQSVSLHGRDTDARCRLAHAIPNGGERSKAVAGRMKAEGARAGVPDIFLPVARTSRGYTAAHGLYVEMKLEKYRNRKNGGRGDDQVRWHEMLANEGYEVVTCYNWLEAFLYIKGYLGHDKNVH